MKPLHFKLFLPPTLQPLGGVGVACPGLGVCRRWTYANPHTRTHHNHLNRLQPPPLPTPPTHPLHNPSPCRAGSTSNMPPPTPTNNTRTTSTTSLSLA